MDTNKPTNKTYLEDRFKKRKDEGSKRLVDSLEHEEDPRIRDFM